MPTDAPLLRFMALSAIIGFIFFCASYAVLVWRKRRAPAPGSSFIRRWSMTFVVFGLIGMAVTAIVRETVRADGIVGGNNLFAVRAPQGMRVVDLGLEGPVKEGDVLARFTSPKAIADLQKAEHERNGLKQQKERLEQEPPALNREIVNERDLAQMRLGQLRSTFANLLPSKVGAERDIANSVIAQRDRLASVENESKVVAGELAQARAKLKSADQQLKREQDLARNRTVSTNDLNDREKEVRSLQAEITKLENSAAAIETKRQQTKESLVQLEERARKDGIELGGELEDTRKELADARNDFQAALARLAKEKQDAPGRHRKLIDEVDTKIAQADDQITALRNELVALAPFGGAVVYRHASPGAALNQGPVLVLSPAEGLRFHFRLPEDQVEALRMAGTVMVELAETDNTVEQRFPAKFLAATTLTREPGMAKVDLECQLPPETVAAMAEGKPIKARFSWRPPVMDLWPFPVSLFLFAIGVLGLFWTKISGWRPTWPVSKPAVPVGDDEDITVSYARVPVPVEGDTVEAVADTVPLRLPAPGIPKETPIPWEHPVGIRLREAIIREDISVELIDTLDAAIEQKKGALVDSIRDALGRVPTVPEHARRLVDKLNNADTDDEMQLLAKRCLAQRLTFLLYTIGVDLPVHAQSSVYKSVDLFDVGATRS